MSLTQIAQIPTDGANRASGGGHAPGVGVIGILLDTNNIATDKDHNQSAPQMVSQTSEPLPKNPVFNTGASASAGGAASVTLTGVAGKTLYLMGFSVTTDAPAAIQKGTVTVGAMAGGITLNYILVETVASGGQLLENFTMPAAANGAGASITISVPAIGSGGNVQVNAWGFSA